MILLDTDMLTLLLKGHARVQKRMQTADADVATTVITWMEVLLGRFQLTGSSRRMVGWTRPSRTSSMQTTA
jgi:predicted nucleic acid-binding protein